MSLTENLRNLVLYTGFTAIIVGITPGKIESDPNVCQTHYRRGENKICKITDQLYNSLPETKPYFKEYNISGSSYGLLECTVNDSYSLKVPDSLEDSLKVT